jgi:hypothetical protein
MTTYRDLLPSEVIQQGDIYFNKCTRGWNIYHGSNLNQLQAKSPSWLSNQWRRSITMKQQWHLTSEEKPTSYTTVLVSNRPSLSEAEAKSHAGITFWDGKWFDGKEWKYWTEIPDTAPEPKVKPLTIAVEGILREIKINPDKSIEVGCVHVSRQILDELEKRRHGG